MADHNRRRLLELLKVPGNNECADCGRQDPEWASCNLGVFLCTECAGIHRSLGSHVSRVRSLRLDKWEDAQVDELAAVGNAMAKAKYEAHVPACYRRPNADDVSVVKEQWVRAKYEREEFVHPDRQIYQEGRIEGWLNKQGKEDGRFHPRRFVLSDGTLKYYVKESHKEPKATIPVSEINAVFCPEKIGNKHGLQLSYVKDGSTRNIFVYSEDGKTIVDWYSALRAAKLHHLQVAFPGAKESQLVPHLTRDFLREGWLWKSGPRPADQHRRRWFTLDDRKWMYHEDPLDAYPKGEIFLGHRNEGYSVQSGGPHAFKEMPFAFTVTTPHRKFVMGAESDRDRSEWIAVLGKVMERPLTPQDTNMAATLVRKRPSFSASLQILKVR
ncbi:arf-GAP with dual PH domain-containing protein 1-like [Haemaphysalis longicornis]